MSTIQRVLILLCSILFTASARADLLVPGTKPVEHTFAIEDSPLLAGHDLVAFPVRGFGGVERIVPGTAFAVAKAHYGTKVYALAKGTELPANANAEWFADKLCAALPVRPVDSVPVSSLTTSIRTSLVVSALSPGNFTLAVANEERERNWTTVPLIAGALVIGALGLLVVRRMRKA
jgi:hypothetical protein